MNRTLKVYKASAGSGKTFTLALEYIKLLVEDPLAYRNILAVTFTNKATGEMKERILSKLYGVANRLKSAADYMDKLKEGLSVLTPEDTLVLCGDLSWALGLENAREDFAWINEIPGRKIILKGNHDYWWTTKKKMDNYLLEKGFDSLQILFNNSFDLRLNSAFKAV